MSEDLPEGWACAVVSDLATIGSGKFLKRTEFSPEPTTDRRFAVVGAGGVIGWTSTPNEPEPIMTLGRVGACGALHQRNEGAWVTDNALVVRPREETLRRWLGIFFLTVPWSEIRSGTSQPLIKQTTVLDLDVPLPPLAEQRRIVAKVEALLAEVNAVRERLAKVPGILKRFRQSVLAAACSGRLTEDINGGASADDSELAEGWRTATLESLLPEGGIFDGPFGSALKTEDYTDKGVRVVRLENLGHLRFIEKKRTFVSLTKGKELVKHSLSGGDIIFGSFVEDDVRVCVLPALPTPAINKADCFCLRPFAEINRRFLALQLASRKSRNSLVEEIHGATRPRINTTQLRRLEVVLCGRAEQDEIVRRVEALFKVADAIETHVSAATARADKITQAILAKAFRGELVPTEAELAREQGREYEPASILLERIRCHCEGVTSRGVRHRCRRAASAVSGDGG